MGVLRGPLVEEPAEWYTTIYIASKKNGKPRRTADFQGLNKACVCQTHLTKSPFLQCQAVPAGTVRMTLDAWNGYHSMPQKESYRHLAILLMPWV